MPAKIDIVATVSGAAQAERALQSLGRTAQGTARQVTAASTGGLSARREFMAGQRLQGTITGMLGVNNTLTQSIDGFERLGYMAQASGMKTGEFLKTVGPGAVSTAAAVLGLTMAWRSWNGEIEKTSTALSKAGFNKQGAWEGTKSILAGSLDAIGIGKGIDWIADNIGLFESSRNLMKPQTLTRSDKYLEAQKAEDLRRFQERVAARERGRKGDEARLDPWFDLFGGMAKGGAKLPSAETYGSREYLAKQQEIQEAPRQTQLAEATLAVLERMLTEIRASNGAGNAVFSWP